MDDGIGAPLDITGPVALVVDDAEENRYVARQLLDALGYVVLEATNGQEALSQLNRSLLPVELMVLDLKMPVLDGYGVLAQLDSCRWHPRVIVVSAFIRQSKTDVLQRADSVMGKPLDLERFMSAVKAFAGVS